MTRLVLALLLCALVLAGCAAPGVSGPPAPPASTTDDVFATAYAQQQHDLQVTGTGTVTRVLSDDNEDGRHQRFILELASGQTLLIAHNIDVAPRIPSIREGDVVEFSGVYEWNEEGGVVHWTHHDPLGQHTAGWLKHNGTVYQ